MLILTSIRNLSGLNSVFETGIGEFLWWVISSFGLFALFAIQALSVISLVYTVCLFFISVKKPKRDYEEHEPQKRFLVFVPAHNEETVVSQIVDNLLNKINYPKELFDVYVIADNCTDNTALISRNAGANVIEHFSAPDEPKGKPYGIKYALDMIGDQIKQYDCVAIFDADNLVSVDYFREMNSQMLSNPEIKVSQGYLDAKNVDTSPVSLGYSLAYYQSNRFFCYARNTLGVSPVIGGTGYVMDVQVLEEIGWTVNSLTEDLELQMQCALAGYRVVWNHFAPIYDEKPTGYKQSIVQRVRWARGHWTVKRRYFNKLVWKTLKTYFTTGVIDKIALDSAFYAIMPLAVAASPIVLVISVLTAKSNLELIGMAVVFVGMLVGSVLLARYAMGIDSRQTSKSSVWRMCTGMLWYLVSAMFIYLYGILTYKENVWVRTQHNVDTTIHDLLSVIEE